MIQFTEPERKVLQALGRSEHGRNLVVTLNRLKNEMTSISSIDGTKDYGAQVEGRKLFGDFIDTITRAIETQKRTPLAIDPEDYT